MQITLQILKGKKYKANLGKLLTRRKQIFLLHKILWSSMIYGLLLQLHHQKSDNFKSFHLLNRPALLTLLFWLMSLLSIDWDKLPNFNKIYWQNNLWMIGWFAGGVCTIKWYYAWNLNSTVICYYVCHCSNYLVLWN